MKRKAKRPDKYLLYQHAVQSPEVHVDWMLGAWKDLRRSGPAPKLLREDFCGTYAISCEWVKRSSEHRAIGLDLDPEPLAWGLKHNWKKLDSSQRGRVEAREANVLNSTARGADLLFVGNFSFFIFKERAQLLNYFRIARSALSSRGLFMLEMAGGPGMIAPLRERKTVRIEDGKSLKKFQYIWHQKKFDPISHDALYAIHFKLEDGSRLDDAFVYDWRLWSIPEVKDLLLEAGFSDAVVYWEKTQRGEGTGDYVRMSAGDNAYSWIAYVVGVK